VEYFELLLRRNINNNNNKGKGKVVPETGRGGP
jgi:hypothetical protein